MRLARFSVLPVLLLAPLLAYAASFPDVTASYAHRDAVLKLADMGVIGGHPDGSFKPYDPVDRASLLKMLYKAAGHTADPSKTKCFPDVQPGSWYETIVCDASSRGFVQGYDNGKSFKPGRAVTRAEALKLSIAVFGIAQTESEATIYTDVTAADWFAPFVRTALARKILPVFGMEGPLLRPSMPLERGQAAAYIWNTINAQPEEQASETPAEQAAASSSAAASRPAGMTEREKELAAQRANESKGLADDLANTFRQSFPFNVTKNFNGRHALSYRFVAGSKTTTDIAVTLAAKGSVTCRLYRLLNDAISTEYYLGTQEDMSCYLRVTLAPGEYQLDLQGSVENSQVTVNAATVKGDGNDGFSEAKSLEMRKIRLDALESNDLDDWYMFKITHSTSVTDVPGQVRTVSVVGAEKLGCIIYPMEDVDLFGFDSPVCNESFLFPVGTYLIDIRHAPPRAVRQTYSIEVR